MTIAVQEAGSFLFLFWQADAARIISLFIAKHWERKGNTMKSIKKITFTALLAALCYVATVIIQIPSPMQGYLNLGDCFVLLAGWLLGPIYGGLGAGVGSMLGDLLTGYGIYASATFLIKALMAVVAGLLFSALKRVMHNKTLVPHILSGIAAEIIMVIGYFLFACLIMGEGWTAALSIPGNLVQGAAGAVAGVLVIELLHKTNAERYFT